MRLVYWADAACPYCQSARTLRMTFDPPSLDPVCVCCGGRGFPPETYCPHVKAMVKDRYRKAIAGSAS